MMLAALLRRRRTAFRLGWLAGSIFDKELRVASRRRRNYWLRLGYVMLLAMYIAVVWIPAVELQGSAVMSRAQMARAARTITQGIVWFQFFGAQLVALVMMSTAISDEVHGRTLCALMMTPLSGVQVVATKLSSRLLQILLLVATSLPLLAIVRVLGGIPWNYLIGSLCITVAAVIFVSSVSLFFSTLCRRPYGVVILSAAGVGGIFALVPFIGHVLQDVWRWPDVDALLYVNPYVLLAEWTDYMISRPGRSPLAVWWPVASCCAILLTGAALLFACSVWLVRHVALRRAMGDRVLLDKLRIRVLEDEDDRRATQSRRRGIRRVIGPPMIWKELVCSLSRRQRIMAIGAVGIELLLLFIAYTFGAVMESVGYEEANLMYIWVFMGLAVFFTVVVSATLVSTEMEARTWPLLLVTPLRDWDLLLGKFAGLVRRCGPLWLPLVAYVLLFTWARIFHPLAIPHILVFSLAVLFFVGATGLYLSARIGRTTAAVTAHLALIGGIWLILPIGLFTATEALDDMGLIGRDVGDVLEGLAVFVPYVHGFLLVDRLLEGDVNGFEWADSRGCFAFLLMVMAVAGSYAMVGSLFVARARKAFRRTTPGMGL